MRRRMLFLAVALGLLTAGLSHPTVAADSCDECASSCSMIPMDPGDCLQLYCPECAGGASPVGLRPIS